MSNEFIIYSVPGIFLYARTAATVAGGWGVCKELEHSCEQRGYVILFRNISNSLFIKSLATDEEEKRKKSIPTSSKLKICSMLIQMKDNLPKLFETPCSKDFFQWYISYRTEAIMIRLNKLLLMITTRDNNVIIMKTEESNNECRGKV